MLTRGGLLRHAKTCLVRPRRAARRGSKRLGPVLDQAVLVEVARRVGIAPGVGGDLGEQRIVRRRSRRTAAAPGAETARRAAMAREARAPVRDDRGRPHTATPSKSAPLDPTCSDPPRGRSGLGPLSASAPGCVGLRRTVVCRCRLRAPVLTSSALSHRGRPSRSSPSSARLQAPSPRTRAAATNKEVLSRMVMSSVTGQKSIPGRAARRTVGARARAVPLLDRGGEAAKAASMSSSQPRGMPPPTAVPRCRSDGELSGGSTKYSGGSMVMSNSRPPRRKSDHGRAATSVS